MLLSYIYNEGTPVFFSNVSGLFLHASVRFAASVAGGEKDLHYSLILSLHDLIGQSIIFHYFRLHYTCGEFMDRDAQIWASLHYNFPLVSLGSLCDLLSQSFNFFNFPKANLRKYLRNISDPSLQ